MTGDGRFMEDKPAGQFGPVARLVLDHGDCSDSASWREASSQSWQLSIQPAGQRMCTAYQQSPDGRHRRFVAAPDATRLLERLDAIEKEDTR